VRFLIAIGLVFGLGGCVVGAIPPAVTVASYAVDGVSYIATGKSLTDHAISEVAGEDCVLIRAAVLEDPCRERVQPDSALAVDLETRYGGETVSTDLAQADLAAGAGPAPSSALADAAPRPDSPTRYVVLGSFRERANAERARRAQAVPGAAVVAASVRGRPVFRVVAPRTSVRTGAPAWIIAPCAAGRGEASSPCLDRAAAPAGDQLSDRSAARPARPGRLSPGG
jgi:hypothetical protein